jgi:hypothetical protein
MLLEFDLGGCAELACAAPPERHAVWRVDRARERSRDARGRNISHRCPGFGLGFRKAGLKCARTRPDPGEGGDRHYVSGGRTKQKIMISERSIRGSTTRR